MTTRVIQGHAVDVLNAMEAESCHLVCTSPPYWNLRAYGTPPQLWPNPDGTPLCADGAHEWGEMAIERNVQPQRDSPGGFHNSTSRGEQPATRVTAAGAWDKAAVCLRCGAMRCELGQEPTVDRYVADLVSVFDAVRRVLRRDGLCWVNLSGSFFNNPGGQNGTSGNVSARAIAANGQAGRQDRIGAAGKDSWLKPLDWVDTPGLFAHAMQKRGWWWRADIALIKRSPLPESVQGTRWERCRVKVAGQKVSPPGTYKGDPYQGAHGRAQGAVGYDPARGGTYFDSQAQWADCPGCSRCVPNDSLILRHGNGRPTRAWERFLVFAKAPGAYFDSEAVREPVKQSSLDRLAYPWNGQRERGYPGNPQTMNMAKMVNPAGRNLRDWQFWPTTGGVGGLQHFAAYPIPLAELAIRAGTSERGVCGTCGAPWARVVERRFLPQPDVRDAAKLAKASGKGLAAENGWGEPPRGTTESETTGWRPTCPCGHDAPVVSAVVLDPFVGSGTTLIAADRLGRSAIGIDVQPTYIDLAAGRARRDAPLFADVEVERQAEQASKQRDLFSVLDELQEREHRPGCAFYEAQADGLQRPSGACDCGLTAEEDEADDW
jgi:DNA modification methylase